MKQLVAAALLLMLCTASAWAQVSNPGLHDPGSNGIVTRTAPHVTGVAAASDVVGLFSGCSGTLPLTADGACHTALPDGITVTTQPVDSGDTKAASDAYADRYDGLITGGGPVGQFTCDGTDHTVWSLTIPAGSIRTAPGCLHGVAYIASTGTTATRIYEISYGSSGFLPIMTATASAGTAQIKFDICNTTGTGTQTVAGAGSNGNVGLATASQDTTAQQTLIVAAKCTSTDTITGKVVSVEK